MLFTTTVLWSVEYPDLAAVIVVALGLITSFAALSIENARLSRGLAHAHRLATLGQLAASIAHEVNQPLGAARNNAHAALRFLGRVTPDLAEVRQALVGVVDDTCRAGDILATIREQTRNAPPRLSGVDLNRVIEEAIALVRGELSKHRVTLRTELAEGLAPARADRVQLQQVLLNLMLNAIEAMSLSAGGRRELSIRTEASGARGLLVAVCDSGPGVARADRERDFDAFYSTKPGGVGIGLSICRSILDAHSGRLWVEVHPPRGAAFRFTLPVQR